MVDIANENLKDRPVHDELKESYLNYAMSVIVGRALPDVRDGLKPVHRRVLHTMNELGNHSNKPYKKSARIVGDCLGKYHPHGDMAVYDSIVRMVQDFSLRYPLIDGQGNFGSIDGDEAAAMRYTEVRMSKIAEEMLADIDKETVDFIPNFDGSLKEPVVLPSRFPNLLVNGSSGIAVGMATNMPPHNLREICDAICFYIDNPNCTVADLMRFVQGPDFPTGGLICGRSGIHAAYATGKGSIIVRAKAEVKDVKDRKRIIITEIPFMVNKARLIEQIAELVNEKRIEGISDLRDESDREGLRVVVELKRDANPDVVLNQLYNLTYMQSTFGVINLALVNGETKVLSLIDLIRLYVEHRKDVITRRCRFELARAEERAHIVEGLRIALSRIDEVVRTLKASDSPQFAISALISGFGLTEKQAQAILEMKLQRLTGLEREKLDAEHTELLGSIAHLKRLLSDEKLILEVIKADMRELKEKYGDDRRTQIIDEVKDIMVEDLIPHERMVVTITNRGYIKRISLNEYEIQRRGGRGLIGVEAKEEDFATNLLIADTHDYLLFFTDKGNVHWLKVYMIPEAGRYAAGKAIVNLLDLKDEKVKAFIPVREFKDTEYLIFATKKGMVKKTPLAEYSNPRRGGIIALILREGDDLVEVKRIKQGSDIILATRDGMSIRFGEEEVRPVGRASMGVIGIRLSEGDEVVSMTVAEAGDTILTVCENGYGKRTEINEYRKQGRGGYGIINIQTTERNGKVVAVRSVKDDDELVLVNSEGVIIRIPAREIPVIGRNTQGVRLMRLTEGAKVVALDRVAKDQLPQEQQKNESGSTPPQRPEVGEIEIL